MRLERLHIAGFKSFPDRSELDFDRGVTAIVGPNGCGKSNVADAITWVLGEQSAKSLRGVRMEDVIFSGSEGRKPGGAAEVTLRLTGLTIAPRSADAKADVELDLHVDETPAPIDVAAAAFHPVPAAGNGDNGLANGHAGANGNHAATDEPQGQPFTRDVDVTRRLFRSGESEYLIDDHVCRLRDIHDLLMDTGLGAKAYAIIEQGKIGMILSSRPIDRRQLIEEAAGITKYKSRRRAAELKLEAAQLNLTRIDDIVFEVERQRGTLKRQAAKARRYRRLRDELQRWEKVLFAGRYRELARALDDTRSRLGEARERDAAAAAHVAETEAELGRYRLEQVEADNRASEVRDRAHTHELEMNRRQQQREFDRHQAEALAERSVALTDEVRLLEQRRGPARAALEARGADVLAAERARDETERVLHAASEEQSVAQRGIEGLDSDVEARRSEVFSALNAATALRHAVEHATGQRERVNETLGRLHAEHEEARRESERVRTEREAAAETLRRAHQAIETLGVERTARESELVTARAAHEDGARDLRAREHELAGIVARLGSLEELRDSRSEFSDAAQAVLAEANGQVGQMGAVADYVDVDARYERAVEACLGDLLQYVIVEQHDQAAAGLTLVREEDAGRCGFVVIEPGSNGYHPRPALEMKGIVPLAEVVRVDGPHAVTIQKIIPEAYIADGFEQAVACARETSAPVVTLEGDVLHGRHLVEGGLKVEARGIFAVRREVTELRARVEAERAAIERLSAEVANHDLMMAQAASAITALEAERHRQEKAIVGLDAQVARATEEAERLGRKNDVIALERARAEEEDRTLDARQQEAQASILRLQEDQQQADERLKDAQRRLMEARGAVEALGARSAETRAAHAGLVERASGLVAEVSRLEEAQRELEDRLAARNAEIDETGRRRASLLEAVAEAERRLDDDVQTLDTLRNEVQTADAAAHELREQVDAQDTVIHKARTILDGIRTEVGQFDVARASAESDLAHLAQMCLDTVQESLDAVLADVERLEAAGEATPDAATIVAEEPDPDAEDGVAGDGTETPVTTAEPVPASMTAEEAIIRLKAKIDRLGPVNMIAIEQFDELEARHGFLTTQRQDLIDSIAQTTKAIARIDETSRARFAEALEAIQRNFQASFSTLFGGGRAGLALLNEDDPLESGIDIVASPPGKRLQSVQLLSGGEKALTAIALMFAIFRYKPSPFCLLDEIDAPLDDANVGRFVDMLHGMLDHTQFILITHNRRTMEIADRLYGITMEEPGVSKLISVELH
jgi:chromosome segregation protein